MGIEADRFLAQVIEDLFDDLGILDAGDDAQRPAAGAADLHVDIEHTLGTTGINTLRIYSPAKQVLDQDPQGKFIHRWCPELAPLTGRAVANPETLGSATQARLGVRIGRDYPHPLVDHATVTRTARSRIYDIRKTAEARAESPQVLQKHGSRKRAQSPRRLPRRREDTA